MCDGTSVCDLVLRDALHPTVNKPFAATLQIATGDELRVIAGLWREDAKHGRVTPALAALAASMIDRELTERAAR